MAFDPVMDAPSADLASAIVWFDAYVTNVDRTPRNTNILVWHGGLWLIDHGASLYFHHACGSDPIAQSRTPFARIKDHVLLPFAAELPAADVRLAERVARDVIECAVAAVPDGWLTADTRAVRQVYVDYLSSRLQARHRGGGPCTSTRMTMP